MATSARNSPGVVRILASRDPNRMSRPETVAYTAVNDILDGKISVGQLTSICGVVKDAQLPIKCRGSGPDYKMTIRLADKSSDASCSTIALHMFAKSEGDMPSVGAFDVMYIHKAKVQTYGGSYSLLSSDFSNMFLYAAAVLSLPMPSAAGQSMTTWARAVGRRSIPVPDNAMTAGAVALFKDMSAASGSDMDFVVEEFKIQVARSTNIRDKRSALKDVRSGHFHDLLVRVVAEPHHFHDNLASMWVSDYTVNDEFEKKGTVGLFADFDAAAAAPGSSTGTAVGDEHGYLDKYTAGSGGRNKKTNQADANWTGPVGRRSMLVSCFDEHARAVMAEVRRGSWVKLANVHITYGRHSSALEGFMRTDPDAFGHRLSVEVLDMDDLDHETMDPLHLEAMKQQDRYDKTRSKFIKEQKKRQQRAQKQQQQQQQQQAGRKRKDGAGIAEGDAAENSRQRRTRLRLLREAGQGGSEAGDDDDRDASPLAASDVTNRAIVCEAGRQPATPLAHVLQPALYASLGQACTGDSGTVLPFANVRFKAKVRVVDFMPHRLADFAVGRWVSQLELIGQHNDEDVSSSEDDDDSGAFGVDPRGGRDSSYKFTWEWRFALLLEDASDLDADADPAAEKPRIWTVVTNTDAQLLTAMDACDLTKSSSALTTLREKMFLLWGNLEENKQEEARRAAEAEQARRMTRQRQQEAAALQKQREREDAARQERERVQREKDAAAAIEAREKAKEAREAQKAERQRARMIAVQTGDNLKAYPADASSDVEPEDDEPEQTEQTRQIEQTPASQAVQPETPAQPEALPDRASTPEPIPPLSNRPFVCCLRQFGIWARAEESTDRPDKKDDMSDDDDDDDDDEEKREWRQMFSLYGTSIRG